MTGTGDDALFADPLDALRASDHRPLLERWRDRASGISTRVEWSNYVRRVMVGLGACTLLLAIGWRLFVTSQPPVEDSLPIAQRSAEPVGVPLTVPSADVIAIGSTNDAIARSSVVVHVAGAVGRPGLVSGAEGWRVNDAVDAAGGALATADLNRINLAAPIADGQRIFVPHVGEVEPALVTPSTSTGAGTGANEIVNINVADGSSLEELPGIGPATAEAILAHRNEHGPFATVDALVAVSGIGPATLERLRDRVSVG